MRGFLIVAAASVPLLFAVADEATAQVRLGDGGFQGGGMRGGGFSQGGPVRLGAGYGGGVRPGFGGRYYQGGPVRLGSGYRGAVRPGLGGYGYRRGYYGYGRRGAIPFYGAAAGLGLGALAGGYGYGYGYDYPYAYGGYPYAAPYPVRRAYVAGPIGGYCATSVKTCQLINPSVIGGGCSCRVAGGRARGEVVGP